MGWDQAATPPIRSGSYCLCFLRGSGVGDLRAVIVVELEDWPSLVVEIDGLPRSIGFLGSGVAVAPARSVLTSPTFCGEIFRGVGFGGATDGCGLRTDGSLFGARRVIELIQTLYFAAQSCMQIECASPA